MGVCLWASIVSRGVDDGVSHNGRTVTPNERTNDREAAACIAPDLFTSCVVVSDKTQSSSSGDPGPFTYIYIYIYIYNSYVVTV
jgi:hypothetical protein